MKTINRLHAIILISLSTVIFPAFATTEKGASIINITKQNHIWEKTPEGAAFANLNGDRFKESYMAMVKLPAGIVSPMHIKTSNMFGIVMSGTFSHIAEGAEPSTEVLLPPGSYYMIPAGLPHISKCVSKTECVSFLYQDGKFDFIPVDNMKQN